MSESVGVSVSVSVGVSMSVCAPAYVRVRERERERERDCVCVCVYTRTHATLARSIRSTPHTHRRTHNRTWTHKYILTNKTNVYMHAIHTHKETEHATHCKHEKILYSTLLFNSCCREFSTLKLMGQRSKAE